MGTTCRTNVIALTIGALALSTLSACDESGQFNLAERLDLRGEDRSSAQTVDTAAEPGTQDVEAPEVFSITDDGLWDGRPSLGGTWVAHPDVDEPDRVIIRNPANGQSVVGALFRRERDIPGPPLQISSDAAAALDMVAGTPQELTVTALRRKETSDEADSTPDDAVDMPADVIETPLDPVEASEAGAGDADARARHPEQTGFWQRAVAILLGRTDARDDRAGLRANGDRNDGTRSARLRPDRTAANALPARSLTN